MQPAQIQTCIFLRFCSRYIFYFSSWNLLKKTLIEILLFVDKQSAENQVFCIWANVFYTAEIRIGYSSNTEEERRSSTTIVYPIILHSSTIQFSASIAFLVHFNCIFCKIWGNWEASTLFFGKVKAGHKTAVEMGRNVLFISTNAFLQLTIPKVHILFKKSLSSMNFEKKKSRVTYFL